MTKQELIFDWEQSKPSLYDHSNGLILDYWLSKIDQIRAEDRGKIESIRENHENYISTYASFDEAVTSGYNYAIEDILSALKEE